MKGNVVMQQFIPTQHWWTVALRGLIALIFGILLLAWPEITLAVLLIFFGAFVLIDGILALFAGLSHAGQGNRLILILHGIVGIAVGIITFSLPGVTAWVLLILIGAWALVTGIFGIIAAFRTETDIGGKLLLGLGGILALIFGLLCLCLPVAGALAILRLIGIYSIIAAIALFILAFMAWRNHKDILGG